MNASIPDPSISKRKHAGSHRVRATKRQRRDGGVTHVEPGMVGFFVSSTRGKERLASKEVSAILIETIESLYPDALREVADHHNNTLDDNNASAPTSIEDEIAAEIKSLSKSRKGNHATEHLHHISLAVDCLFFLQLTPTSLAEAVDPVRVVQETINKAVVTRSNGVGMTGVRTRFASRLIPFQGVCPATQKDIVQLVLDLWNKRDVSKAQSFAIYAKIREGANQLGRDELIAKVAEPIIAYGHKVNLSRPDVAIVIEVYRKVAGVSVITDGVYCRQRKFNLHEVYMKGEDEDQGNVEDEE